MVFISVQNFLNKFKDLSYQDMGPRVLEIITKKFPGEELNIKVKNKEIYISNISPALKSEIFLKQKEILKEVKEILGDNSPLSINFRKF